jgi:hypothetical protein
VLRGREALTAENLLRFMDAHGIELACVLPLVSPEEEDYVYSTEQALDDCSRYPDRLIPFANVDPRRGSNDGHYDFLPLLREYAEVGCRGFGEILANLPTNDPRMKGIYRACGALGFPIVFDFRVGTVGVVEPLGLHSLEECLAEFPGTIFVAHGPAWWAEISRDVTEEGKRSYPSGAVLRPGRVDELLDRYPNLYADLSAMSGYNALARDPEVGREFVIRHGRKLLLGTDWFVGWEGDGVIHLLEATDLPADVRASVCRGNAQRLLRLTDVPRG